MLKRTSRRLLYFIGDIVQETVTEVRVSYPPKMYHCRNCEKTETSQGIPREWYLIRKSDGLDVLRTVAIVCSLACLVHDCVEELVVRSERKERY